MSDPDEVERLKTAIGRAVSELERHIQLNGLPSEPTAKYDGRNQVQYALIALKECLLPEEETRHWPREDPSKMTDEELVDAYASSYRVHSNPAIYRELKAGHDEILARLGSGKK